MFSKKGRVPWGLRGKWLTLNAAYSIAGDQQLGERNAKDARRAKKRSDPGHSRIHLSVSNRQFLWMVTNHALQAVPERITFQLIINPKDKPLNFR